jgi:hypothetical protein
VSDGARQTKKEISHSHIDISKQFSMFIILYSDLHSQIISLSSWEVFADLQGGLLLSPAPCEIGRMSLLTHSKKSLCFIPTRRLISVTPEESGISQRRTNANFASIRSPEDLIARTTRAFS